jgi:tetratricopeptide (TPR) repeat protein
MWLQSCLEHYPADLVEKRKSYFAFDNDAGGFAAIYNEFYLGWLNLPADLRHSLLRYEDLLSGDLSTLISLGLLVEEISPDAYNEKLKRVPQSVTFSSEDRERYRNFECSIAEEHARTFWSRIDSDLVSRLGYSFEQVSFTTHSALRTIAYRVRHRPEGVSSEEFARLVQAGMDRFADDADVLLAIGDRMSREGQVAPAIDWYRAAWAASDREDLAFDDKSNGHALRLDILDRVLRLADEGRLGGIVGSEAVEHYRALRDDIVAQLVDLRRIELRVFRKTGATAAMLANAEIHLCAALCRGGRFYEAVPHAQQAVNLAPADANHRHYLGWLFLQMHRLSEAEEALRMATALAPANKHYAYLLDRVMEMRGGRDEAARPAPFYELSEQARIALTEQAISTKATLASRWAALAPPEADGWSQRAAGAAQLLAPYSSVADIGCGVMTLERHLGEGVRYVPVDVVRRDDRTRVCDLNAQPLPQLDAEAAACLGLLEYLFDPEGFLRNLRGQCRACVVSYNPVDANHAAISQRRAHGWVNDFSASQLEVLFAVAGWKVDSVQKMDDGQSLWRLTSA